MTEALDQETYKKYEKAARIVNSAGGTPLRVGKALIAILRHIVPDEKDLDFLDHFKEKKSQTMEQLRETSGLSEELILQNVKKLAKISFSFILLQKPRNFVNAFMFNDFSF